MKNKLFCILFTVTALILCFALSSSAKTEFTAENVHTAEKVESLLDCLYLGDVNDNGAVMADDARLILRYSVKLEQPDEKALKKADIDKDGAVTAADARQALRYAVKLDDMPDHKLTDIVITQVSCGNDGLIARVCTNCEKVYAIITVAASTEKHVESSWQTVIYPDCATRGLAQIKCVKCDTVIKETSLAKTSTHSGEWVYPNGKSCTEPVTKKRTCTVCGKKENKTEQPVGTCNLVTTCGLPASCTEDGYDIIKCDHCERIENVVLTPAKGHSYDKNNLITTKKPSCHEEGTANAVCSVCGDKNEITLEKLPHSLEGEWQISLPPTCTEAGIKENSCKNCGQMYEIIPATGHSVTVWTNTRPATCSETGLITGTCSVCGENTVEKEIEKLPHDFDTSKPITDSGIRCQEEVTGHYKCKSCDETQDFVLEKVSCTNEKYKKTRIISEATCTQAAVKAAICDYCNETIAGTQSATGSSLGHSFLEENWTTTKPASCTKNGEKECKCTRCDETETKTINATGHIAGPIEEKEATCSEEGAKYLLCAKCDYVMQTIPTAKLDHTTHTIIKADRSLEDEQLCFIVTSREECSVCNELAGEQTTISGIAVDSYYNDIAVFFDSPLTVSKGEKISFTLKNTPANFSVKAKYRSDKEITVTYSEGVYSLVLPEDFKTSDSVIIIISKP